MKLCAVGDIHGAIERMYDNVLAFEATLGITFDAVLHVGDFGIWPDPDRVDKATRRHEGAGDFARWHAEQRVAPRKTIFIKGNEDFDWLDDRPATQVLPGLHYLPNDSTIDLGVGRDAVRVGGLGGCYSPSDYDRRSKQLRGAQKAHYTQDEIETLGRAEEVDVLLLHDAPLGVRFAAGYESNAEGLRALVARVRPAACFFGHHHERIEVAVPGTAVCRGLNLIGRPGNLVAFEVLQGKCIWGGER